MTGHASDDDEKTGKSGHARVAVIVTIVVVVAVAVCYGIVAVRRHAAVPGERAAGVGQSTESADATGEQAASSVPASKSPTDAATPTPSPAADSLVVCLDPGHQDAEDLATEPIGPGSATMKTKMTLGTHGTTTGVPEYEMTLAVGRVLRTELESRGYTVYMTRESSDVNLSNIDRAQYCTAVDADAYIRLHGDGVDAASANGATMLAPSLSNPYLPRDVIESSRTFAQDIIDAYCAATGMHNRGVRDSDDMTGMNWATMPVTLIELGFMTNPTDDANMADPAFQTKMAAGIADGVDAYFGR